MKATIEDLWETGREILAYDGSEFDRPKSISDLRKCENVLVGEHIDGPKSPIEVLIGECLCLVSPVKLRHPSGGGTMYVLEVM
jgi:hypothetical protein